MSNRTGPLKKQLIQTMVFYIRLCKLGVLKPRCGQDPVDLVALWSGVSTRQVKRWVEKIPPKSEARVLKLADKLCRQWVEAHLFIEPFPNKLARVNASIMSPSKVFASTDPEPDWLEGETTPWIDLWDEDYRAKWRLYFAKHARFCAQLYADEFKTLD